MKWTPILAYIFYFIESILTLLNNKRNLISVAFYKTFLYGIDIQNIKYILLIMLSLMENV